MRGRRQPAAARFSLFPFLAVLLCTMGALIVLLMVMVGRAQVEANTELTAAQQAPSPVSVAEAEQPDDSGKITKEERAAQEARLAQLSQFSEKLAELRDKWREALNKQHLDLGHLEEQTLHLREKLEQLRADYEVLQQDTASDQRSREEQQAKLADLARQIADAQRELEEAEAVADAKPKSYSIIPYDGARGTQRRPIYVECRRNQVIIQPEGIVLLKDDLGSADAGNPLAAALRATREYWSGVGGLDTGEPYPLLVVRPDGAAMYGRARRAMNGWSTEYGYELIDADMDLEYPPADEALADVMRRTVSIARKRQLTMARNELARRGAAGSGRPYLAASRNGGFELVGGDGRNGAPRRSSDGPSRPNYSPNSSQPQDNPYVGGNGPGSGGPGDSTNPAGRPGQPATINNQYAANQGQPTGNPGGQGYAPPVASQGPPFSSEQGSGQGGQLSPSVNGNQASSQRFKSPSQDPYARGDVNANPLATPTQNNDAQRGQPPRLGEYVPLAQQRGADWAIDRAGGATGFTRPISVQIHADRLVILPGRDELPRSTALRGPMAASIDQFVTDIRQTVQGWGMAGPQSYWKPVLLVEVYPGGEQRFAELQTIMRGSGIDVQRK